MKNVKITVMAIHEHTELMKRFEMKQENPCMMKIGQSFVSYQACIPKGFCESAWQNLAPYVLTLSCGGGSIYNQWMKNPKSAMISCNDGFRPVSFYLEALDFSE